LASRRCLGERWDESNAGCTSTGRVDHLRSTLIARKLRGSLNIHDVVDRFGDVSRDGVTAQECPPNSVLAQHMGGEKTIFSQLCPGHSNCPHVSRIYHANQPQARGQRQHMAVPTSLIKRQGPQENV
jgi:hypothetical protein